VTAQQQKMAAQQQLTAAQRQVAVARQQAQEADAKFRFRDSICNTYPNLYFEVTAVRVLPVSTAVDAGYARFAQGLPLFEAHGMRPSHCELCRGIAPMAQHDCGFFGDHSKGVYVSKHADYTVHYQRNREPRPGDEGTVLMLDLITGRVNHFDQRRDGAPPTAGFHCHESPNHLEF
jgi:hypothetical protein